MNIADAFVSATEPDKPDNKPDNTAKVRRVVVVPGLWAPFHHMAAVTSLAAFVATVRPDGVVFLNAPTNMSRQQRGAFTDVLTGFRASYAGPIGVHGHGEHDAAALASLHVTVLSDPAPIAQGWLAAPGDLTTRPDVIACADNTGANLVCATTGRLRITGRARPAADGGVRAWLVFECGTLAADPAAGTLGFGILEGAGRAAAARPIKVSADGGFTFHGTRYKTPPGARSGGVRAAPPSVNAGALIAPVTA